LGWRRRLRRCSTKRALAYICHRSRLARPGSDYAFLNLVLTWNTGISYGLFPQQGALGLIIGGAIGNAIDRLAYGAVADFVLFHITTASLIFRWYVFDIAEVAIVIGVAGLIYEMLLGGKGTKK
jgi:signal peptidase II